jgi:endo-1,4-beta-D-glucanase Y
MIRQILQVLLLLGALPAMAHAQETNGTIQESEWVAYKERFVAENGRVIDDANGRISHSEGQGYGLLLALLANDRADFARIWTFTNTRLLLRDDGLAVWKWDPDAEPHVSDPNNASDGDLLIAYALARAGTQWNDARFTDAARQIATALADEAIFEQNDRLMLRPGVVGFGADDRPDGPVVNLSYWVFEAFRCWPNWCQPSTGPHSGVAGSISPGKPGSARANCHRTGFPSQTRRNLPRDSPPNSAIMQCESRCTSCAQDWTTRRC